MQAPSFFPFPPFYFYLLFFLSFFFFFFFFFPLLLSPFPFSPRRWCGLRNHVKKPEECGLITAYFYGLNVAQYTGIYALAETSCLLFHLQRVSRLLLELLNAVDLAIEPFQAHGAQCTGNP